MPFIGNKPSAVPLTSADITDGIITSAKIADGTIVNADINASAGVVFTKLASTGTLTVDNIQFPATQVASTNANNLDDYEEGTFTPSITFGNNSVGITYATDGQKGFYTKIGRVVNGTVWIQLTNKGSSTGTARIAGLPFTSINQTNGYHGASIDHYFSISTYASIGTYLPPNESGFILTGGNPPSDIATSITNTQFNNDTYLIMSFMYQI